MGWGGVLWIGVSVMGVCGLRGEKRLMGDEIWAECCMRINAAARIMASALAAMLMAVSGVALLG